MTRSHFTALHKLDEVSEQDVSVPLTEAISIVGHLKTHTHTHRYSHPNDTIFLRIRLIADIPTVLQQEQKILNGGSAHFSRVQLTEGTVWDDI